MMKNLPSRGTMHLLFGSAILSFVLLLVVIEIHSMTFIVVSTAILIEHPEDEEASKIAEEIKPVLESAEAQRCIIAALACSGLILFGQGIAYLAAESIRKNENYSETT